MIGHEDEFVQLVFSLCAVVLHCVEEQERKRFGAEEVSAPPGGGGDEEGADFLRGVGHGEKPGLKPESIQDSFHHAEAWCFHPLVRRVAIAGWHSRRAFAAGDRGVEALAFRPAAKSLLLDCGFSHGLANPGHPAPDLKRETPSNLVNEERL